MLGGNLILPQASCKTCEGVLNSGVESKVAAVFDDHRQKHDFPSRRRRRRQLKPTHKSLTSTDGSVISVPFEKIPIAIPVHNFGTATLLTGGPPRQVESNDYWDMQMLEDSESRRDHAALEAAHPEWDGTYRSFAWPEAAARLVAKIAYCLAIGHLGTDGFDEEITPIILGKDAVWSSRVGGSREGYLNLATGERGFEFRLIGRSDNRFHLVVDYRMFPGEGHPRYHIVVGTVDPSNPDHRKVFDGENLGGSWKLAAGAPLFAPSAATI